MKVRILSYIVSPTNASVKITFGEKAEAWVRLPIDNALTVEVLQQAIATEMQRGQVIRERMALLGDLIYSEIEVPALSE